ncbi:MULTISPECIES: adenylate/guanylate cyclase domain-containing protein [unclassified Ruegeria]|uniref:adenylate/guanylate cyclase domain-containing protein n=1 Tax=unclassified Ruegeria TaxID=2625375 RepID=UPI001490EB9D|nr:adenylate/guanylate cyclase domain-containing protein [Ruegeria sp. HKCCD5849]NOD53899.1 adenylate/guanylate cyclase domain-containing protein [Ruegeria sp. HKCCD5851]NOD68844.1 adenylate/guanylate cyclase domain-containing protein [Ruegeria sp. HKCCD7303]
MSEIDPLNHWLISEGRLLGDETAIVKGYCEGLVRLGVPLARARIAQNYSNPLLSAWGIIWTPDKTRRYTVPTTVLSTSAWHGSPFEYIVTHRCPLRKRLSDLNLATEHPIYSELAEAGATDFLAIPLEHGNGSVQGTSFTSNAETGFSDAHIRYIEDSRYALAAALEPIAMRQSQKSLLQTYLGHGPAEEIGQGHIKRGEHRTVFAAILFADLRGFTEKAQAWPEDQLLDMMGNYFEMVVAPIQDEGGDVLKFMGDGILAVFEADNGDEAACQSVVAAASQALVNLDAFNKTAGDSGRKEIEFVIGIDFGQVTFGNIGSPDRLDFTVVGQTVNVASRVQDLCKQLGERTLLTTRVTKHLKNRGQSVGYHAIRGLSEDIEVFRVPAQVS